MWHNGIKEHPEEPWKTCHYDGDYYYIFILSFVYTDELKDTTVWLIVMVTRVKSNLVAPSKKWTNKWPNWIVSEYLCSNIDQIFIDSYIPLLYNSCHSLFYSLAAPWKELNRITYQKFIYFGNIYGIYISFFFYMLHGLVQIQLTTDIHFSLTLSFSLTLALSHTISLCLFSLYSQL